MNITSLLQTSRFQAVPLEATDQVADKRLREPSHQAQKPTKTQISSTDMLDKIKELSQDGLYSVHFEMNNEINSMVIRVVDKDSGEVIRQIPAEELIQVAKTLNDLRGLVVDTES